MWKTLKFQFNIIATFSTTESIDVFMYQYYIVGINRKSERERKRGKEGEREKGQRIVNGVVQVAYKIHSKSINSMLRILTD